MSRWGKPIKNNRRIDPRYFLEETANREERLLSEDDDGGWGYGGGSGDDDQSDYGQSDYDAGGWGYGTDADYGQSEDTGEYGQSDVSDDYYGQSYYDDSPDDSPPTWQTWSPYYTGYEEATDMSVPGALRTAMEGGLEQMISSGRPGIGALTDAVDVLQYMDQDRTGDAVKTAGAGIADALGTAGGFVFGGPQGAIVGSTLADQAYRGLWDLAPYLFGNEEDTTTDVYDNYGFWGTLGRGGEEAIDLTRENTALTSDALANWTGWALGNTGAGYEDDAWSTRGAGNVLSDFGYEASDLASETADDFMSGEMFGDTGQAIANSPYNPLSRNFPLWEGKAMKYKKQTLLVEAAGIGTVLAAIIYALSVEELGSRAIGKTGWATQIGRKIKSAWDNVKSAAAARAQQGDPSLEAVVADVETGSAQILQSAGLSDQQTAMIQDKLGDDEKLAQMLSQLESAPPESHQQIIAQIEQYIKAKLN